MDTPTTVSTPRLTLRPPTEADRVPWVRLHRDPRLYTHAPEAVPESDEAAGEHFDDALAHWREHGFGYWVATEQDRVVAPDHGAVVGVVGLRRSGEAYLNLSYRFAVHVHGRGLGTEAARYAVAHATEWLPDLPVRALVRVGNEASDRTALAAGMERIGTEVAPDDLPDGPPSTVFESPRVASARSFDADVREGVLDLWCRVNDAGGAVGFLPGAPRDVVDRTLAAHERAMAEGSQVAALLRSPDGQVVGLGLWSRGPNPLLGHVRTAYRVMTDPDRRGHGLGRVLMGGMHRVARAEGVEIAVLGVRSGYGTADFYRSFGYVETGRLPGAIRVAPGDDRDDITMARRLDERPMRPDGRS